MFNIQFGNSNNCQIALFEVDSLGTAYCDPKGCANLVILIAALSALSKDECFKLCQSIMIKANSAK